MNNVFKALSNPTRRQIIELLRLQDMSAGDIASHFDMAKPLSAIILICSSKLTLY